MKPKVVTPKPKPTESEAWAAVRSALRQRTIAKDELREAESRVAEKLDHFRLAETVLRRARRLLDQALQP